MPFDAFMKIKDIPGESTDDKHKEWLELESYSFGNTQQGSGNTSAVGGESGGRVNWQDFHFATVFSKASPKLVKACCDGQHIGEINVELCRATGEKSKFIEYKFTECFITGVQTGGGRGGGDRPVDQVSFRYGKVEVIYTEYGNDGKKKGDVKAHWDLRINKGG